MSKGSRNRTTDKAAHDRNYDGIPRYVCAMCGSKRWMLPRHGLCMDCLRRMDAKGVRR